MIEKERLEELIKEGKKIWSITNGRVDGLPTSKRDYFDTRLDGTIIYSNDKYNADLKLENLYETQAEAEWVAKMHTEYTEHFNTPLFENLPYEYCFKFIRNGIEHELFCKRDSYIVVISCCKDYMSGTEDMDYTKENYIKAVEIAYKLFKGEE